MNEFKLAYCKSKDDIYYARTILDAQLAGKSREHLQMYFASTYDVTLLRSYLDISIDKAQKHLDLIE